LLVCPIYLPVDLAGEYAVFVTSTRKQVYSYPLSNVNAYAVIEVKQYRMFCLRLVVVSEISTG
jgi:hypothetical protein